MSDNEQGASAHPQIGKEILVRQREQLIREIKELDADIILHFGKKGATFNKDGWFSDWPDSFNNGGTWYKTWGKAGDRTSPATINPAININLYSLPYLIGMVFRKIGSFFGGSKRR